MCTLGLGLIACILISYAPTRKEKGLDWYRQKAIKSHVYFFHQKWIWYKKKQQQIIIVHFTFSISHLVLSDSETYKYRD
jgi:hypothetical protein